MTGMIIAQNNTHISGRLPREALISGSRPNHKFLVNLHNIQNFDDDRLRTNNDLYGVRSTSTGPRTRTSKLGKVPRIGELNLQEWKTLQIARRSESPECQSVSESLRNPALLSDLRRLRCTDSTACLTEMGTW